MLTAWPVVAGAAVLAAGSVVLVPWTWDRWHRPAPARGTLVLVATVLTLFAGGAAVNAQAGFFPTLASLTSGQGAQVTVGRNGVTASLSAIANSPASLPIATARRLPEGSASKCHRLESYSE